MATEENTTAPPSTSNQTIATTTTTTNTINEAITTSTTTTLDQPAANDTSSSLIQPPPVIINSELQRRVQEQLEFYFGNSNLQKDRFLKQLAAKDPEGYVELQTIANFNKMREITKDINLIILAAKSSTMLQLDNENKKIKRSTPVPPGKNVDARTVYTEPLPPDATHESLEKRFSVCGKVEYVSIPRTKDRTIKGFAFIEYETEEGATRAVAELNAPSNPANPIAPPQLRVVSKDTWDRAKDHLYEVQKKERPLPGVYAFVHISNVGPDITTKEIKVALKELLGGGVRYVDYDQEKKEGYLKFLSSAHAQSAIQTIQQEKFVLGGQQISVRLVEGEEQEEYRFKIQNEAHNKFLSKKRRKERKARERKERKPIFRR